MPSEENKEENSGIFSVVINLSERSVILEDKDIFQCYFVEDIYSYCILGKMTFMDSYGLTEFGPFTGTENITIVYGRDEDTEITFDIYKVTKIIGQSDVEQSSRSAIEVYFADRNYRYLNNYRYSRSWGNNVLTSDIIKHISTHMLDVPDFEKFEKSRERMDYFYMPYWTPRMAISWLMKRSSGSETGLPGYLYYQNSKGWNFVTLEKLLEQLSLMKIDEEDDGRYCFEDVNLFYRNKIHSWRISSVDNQAISKLQGGHRFGYNFTSKESLDQDFEYSGGISKFTLLGRITLFPDISKDNGDYILEGDSDTDMLDNINYGEFIKRYSKQQCLIINVEGSEKRYAGGMIEIDWPSTIREGIYNKNLNGKYLVKSIINSFTPDKQPPYVQKMILIKNAYSDSDNKNLMSASRKNVSTDMYVGRN